MLPHFCLIPKKFKTLINQWSGNKHSLFDKQRCIDKNNIQILRIFVPLILLKQVLVMAHSRSVLVFYIQTFEWNSDHLNHNAIKIRQQYLFLLMPNHVLWILEDRIILDNQKNNSFYVKCPHSKRIFEVITQCRRQFALMRLIWKFRIMREQITHLYDALTTKKLFKWVRLKFKCVDTAWVLQLDVFMQINKHIF